MARPFEHTHVLTLVLGELENDDIWCSIGVRESKDLFHCGTAFHGFAAQRLKPVLPWQQVCASGCFTLSHLSENSQDSLDAAPGLASPQAEPGGAEAENKTPFAPLAAKAV